MIKKRLRDLEKPNKYKDFLRFIAKIQIKHPFITLGIILAITIALFGGISQVKTVASLEKMMPTNLDEVKSFNILRDNALSQDMIAVSVNINSNSVVLNSYDITAYEYYLYIKNLESTFKSEDLVVNVFSFASIIDMHSGKKINEVLSKDEYLSLISNPEVYSQASRFINSEKTGTIILITTDVSADDLRMNLLANSIKEKIDFVGKPASTDIKITGTPIIQQKLGEVINHDRHVTETASAIMVFIFVAIVFGSITAALVPMTIIILTIIWLYGIMGYIGLPISTLAGSVAAMVIGIGVDYSIHLRNKFEYERKKEGETLEYAIEETMANTGFVLTIVTIVTSLAFMSFMLGDMPEMGRFGLLMTIGVGIAFVLSVIGLPALFIIEEKVIYFARHHMRFGMEKELVLVREEEIKGLSNKEMKRQAKEEVEHIEDMILTERRAKSLGHRAKKKEQTKKALSHTHYAPSSKRGEK